MGLFSGIGKIIGGVIGGITGATAQARAAERASQTQAGFAQQGIDAQRAQFDQIRALLNPFVAAGQQALRAQGNIAGLNGAEAQQAAIAGIQSGPEFAALQQQGENAILQNASATGGLRGGNTQGALAQFRPALLAQLIQQQFANLGNLSNVGLNAATSTGNLGANSTANVANLLGQQGSALAGGQIARGSRDATAFGQALQIGGAIAGASAGIPPGLLSFGGSRGGISGSAAVPSISGKLGQFAPLATL